ncbi:sulfatase-like hydrolase/transferase [Fluviibacterium sp. DFM31]|uniref:Sulfatase-like hydrolase/transferase n=1 Tax=Meridianimarinicoccus marinus TaxID=3231483 RepID=A0ABV3L9M0_9RHOB
MTQPNILFLLPDQLRPDFLGCYGADFLATPAIDALAGQGVRHDMAISPSPICVPARASMLTGQSAASNGVVDNLSWLRPDRQAMGVRTWPEILSEGGYHTAAIGKMHFYPWDISEGFETRIIAEDKRHIHVQDDYADWLAARGLAKHHGNDQRGYQAHKGASLSDLPDEAQVDRWVAGQAADWLRAYDDPRPFALMVGFPGPHCPYDPPPEALDRIDPDGLPAPIQATAESDSHRDEFIASYKRGWADLDYSTLDADQIRRIRHHYAALVERLDEDVAKVLAALEASGRLDNTIVVFASDHGDYLGDYGLMGKTFFHESSVHVPLIVTDFRAPCAARDAAPRSLLDLFPSFLDWAGLDPATQAQGQPLGAPADAGRVICGMTSLGVMARSARHKLVRYGNGAQALFDLETDPMEQDNRLTDPDLAPVREALEIELLREMLDATLAGHVDKRVPGARSQPPHGFFHRGWSRPYPSDGQ